MLPKQYRLRKTTEYKQVYKAGKKFYTKYFTLIVRRSIKRESLPLPRFGFVASKKVGNAVQRNKAKRLLRAIVTDQFGELTKDFEAVFIVSVNILSADFQTLQTEVINTLAKAKLFSQEQ